MAYNSLPVILTCLESVLRFSHSDEREIIVVDNGSTDGTPEVVKSEFPEVNVIAARENLGFSKANNLGLEHANGQCVCFLNPDTEFRDDTMVVLSDWLWRNRETYGVASCRLVFPDGDTQYSSARSFPRALKVFFGYSGLSRLAGCWRVFASSEMEFWDHQDERDVDSVSGAFLMIPTALCRRIGGFWEELFMYGDDVELCLRVRKAGYGVRFFGNRSIIHDAGWRARQDKNVWEIRKAQMHSWVRVLQRHGSPQDMRRYRLAVRAAWSLRAFFLLLSLPILACGRRHLRELVEEVGSCIRLGWDQLDRPRAHHIDDPDAYVSS